MPEKRPRGRPKVQTPANKSVTTWLTAREYDRLNAIATREAKMLSALVRELVERKVAASKP